MFQEIEEQRGGVKDYAKPEVEYEVTLDSGNVAKFRIIKWSPTEVFNKLSKIGKVFAVPFSMVATASPEEGSTLSEVLPMALIHFFTTMEEEGMTDFFKMILKDVYINNESVVEKFDIIFMEHPEIVMELVAKVVEIHYAPFFKRGFGNLLSSMNLVNNLGQKA